MKLFRRAIAGWILFAALQDGIGASADPSSLNTATSETVSPGSQDLLLLGPIEPTRLRIQIEVDGVPFRTAWLEAFDRLFDRFDNDADGVLTPPQAIQLAVVFGISQPADSSGKSSTMEMAAKSGSTRNELRERFQQLAPPLKLNQKLSSGGAGPALVPLLDTDGDGRLSREELIHAAQSLHCRDFDDDQLITELELAAGPALAESNSPGGFAAGSGSVILLTSAMDASAVAEILLARYDRNRDGVLSLRVPAEIQSEVGNLSTLDVDGDQILNRNELRGYMNLPLDAELPFALGGDGRRKSGSASDRYRLRSKGNDGGFRLHVGSREITFSRKGRNPNQDENRVRLQDSDADKSGDLDETEYATIANRPDFVMVDTDRSGKISAMEFDAFFQMKSRTAAVQIILDASEQGADLFRSLDLNGDRVLTPRELLRAPLLLKTDDLDHDGYLGGSEMSYNLVLELSRGTARIQVNQRAPSQPRVKVDRTGPAWFLKMDRNRDGDVGLPEFVGSQQVFSKLDTDGDGLLSVDEANAVAK